MAAVFVHRHVASAIYCLDEEFSFGSTRKGSFPVPVFKGEDYPEGWIDPLELYGVYLWELIELELDLVRERTDLQDLIDKKGPEYVWENPQRLVAERLFIRDI